MGQLPVSGCTEVFLVYSIMLNVIEFPSPFDNSKRVVIGPRTLLCL